MKQVKRPGEALSEKERKREKSREMCKQSDDDDDDDGGGDGSRSFCGKEAKMYSW